MPIMRPEHQAAMRNAQKVLNEIGVDGAKKPVETSEEDLTPVRAALNRVGLSLDELAEEIAIKVKSGNEGISNRAIETALKMHGALKESAAAGPSAPSFTIVIQDSKSSQNPSSDLNIPAGVNPIFLPRQLSNQLKNENPTN